MKAHAITGYKAARLAAGVSVTYRRGTDEATLSVLPGSSKLEVLEDGRGITRDEHHSEDFLILASELVLDSAEVTPERFDEIDIDGRTLRAFDASGVPHWEYADQYRAVIRVRCKGVE